MTKLDQFESVFKAADKPVYDYLALTFNRILLVSDLAESEAEALMYQVQSFLSVIKLEETTWQSLSGADFTDIKSLLGGIEEAKPDLIVTYRHLHSDAWQWPHSLGEYLDVMTQATSVPVLVLPHPDGGHALPHSIKNTDRVMAITDHLAGDSQLVNIAVALTAPGGVCWLTHIESQPKFDRYLDAISKISMIDTDIVRETLPVQLLKEPADFIGACQQVALSENLPVTIEKLVMMGSRIEEYKQLIEDREIDLLVLYTKDDDQLAMHGSAYPLAVELRQIPLLML